MKYRKCVCLVAAAAAMTPLMLTGCQLGSSASLGPDSVQLQQARDAVLASTDWSGKTDVTIEMLDYGYRPREVRLKLGQPYRITLVNHGSVNHYFTAPEFLSSVATRKVEVRNQVEVKAPVFTSFELQGRGGSLDIYLVPMTKGSYRAHCHMKDHLSLGIEGTLIVE